MYKTSIAKMCFGIGISLFIFSGGNVSSAAELTKSEPLVNEVATADKIIKKNIIPPSYFTELLRKTEEVQPVTLKFTVLKEEDFVPILIEMNNKMPDRVEITSPIFSRDQLYKMYGKVEFNTYIDIIPNFKNLFSYKKAKSYGKKLILEDDVIGETSVKRVYAAYEIYVDMLSRSLKGSNEEETLVNIYNYVYNNFEYTAMNRRNMYIPNIGSGKMACNGLSRLMNDLLNHAGITSEIRQGESHYWNIVKLKGQLITVDVTTDILKKQPFLTLGTSTKEHIGLAITTGLYNASFDLTKYKEIKKSTFKKANKLPIY